MGALAKVFTRNRIAAAAIVLALLSLALYAFAPRIQTAIRDRTLAVLRARFESDVQVSDFHVSVSPLVRVSIRGLVMRHKGRTDVPPLVEAREIRVHAYLLSLLLPKPHLSLIRLEGLQIHIPPRGSSTKPFLSRTDEDLAKKYPVLIDEIDADDAVLVTLRAEPDKPPREFPIHHLEMHDVSFDQPSEFHAMLTNPVPRGEIDSQGAFGPWQGNEPSLTPVNASYTLENADMATLKGLKGTLASQGQFSGSLDSLNVQGKADVPNFSLRTTDQPVPLETEFSAVVNGTNGDTILKSVAAKFLRTSLAVSGKVIDADPKVKGRSISVECASNEARIEDLLRIAVKSDEPLMTGSARIKAKIDIPEGDSDLLDRLKLTGQFDVASGQFTSPEVQNKIDELSRKGQGQPKATDIDKVVSELSGSFRLSSGVVMFTDLHFAVTGARLQLNGTYNIDTSEMDFHGKLELQAKLSQTTTGVKSLLLKGADPFFKGKNAGTVLSIQITGTKDNPSFGLDKGGGGKKEEAAPVKKGK